MKSEDTARWTKFIHDDLTNARAWLWKHCDNGPRRAFLTKRIAEDETILTRLRGGQGAATMAGPQSVRAIN